jgi:uncharacterized membrane protein YedE/YeeE
MIAPIAFLSGSALLWAAIGFGLVFGFLLHRGGLTDFDVIVRLFQFRDFTVLKVMLTAIVVGGVGVAILHGYDLAQFHIKPLNTLAVGLGAAIFGVGMVLYGYCPGTGLAALATGRVDALAGLVGMLLGGVAYALCFDWVAAHILPVGAFGKLRIPELLSLPEWTCYLGLLAMAAGIFYLIGRYEPKTTAYRDIRA